ncbi:DNA helicase [Tanacetum coccineum]
MPELTSHGGTMAASLRHQWRDTICGGSVWMHPRFNSMADTQTLAATTTDKGKMTAHTMEITALNDIKPVHSNKTIEARVYRKWTAMNVTREPTNFCCILLDKQGNAIQANMNLKDTDYFDQLLQLNNAYRISRFLCTKTKKWQQTVDNETTFIAYNEVEDRADVNGTRLIEGFDKVAYAAMPKPVVIAVSSTWATRRYGGLQLTATPATHYYLNPNIPEANYILNV